MISAVILDFDGVILDSMNIKSQAFAYIYCELCKDKLDFVIDYHLKTGGMSRYKKFLFLHKYLLDIDLTKDEIIVLDKKFSEFVLNNISKSEYVAGVKDFIEDNYRKYKLFVSSGSPKYELEIILKTIKIKRYFHGIYGSPREKIEHINKIKKKFNLYSPEIVFVGDGLKDKEAANQTNIHFVARIVPDSQLNEEKFKINDFIGFEEVLKQINK
jgi:phosphoglycolate phosphatase-like HAD superfamily hydrolase